MVVAKFFVSGISKLFNPGQSEETSANVTLQAAYGEENKDWSKWTPSGSIQMNITNPEAFKQFEPGKHYRVTFEQVD